MAHLSDMLAKTWRSLVVSAVFLFLLYKCSSLPQSNFRTFAPKQAADEPINAPSVRLVVSSMSKDNTTWLAEAFPHWDRQIYVVDDPTAQFTVPRNKGKEGMVYLTHIIDNYDELPEVTIFRHSDRYQWHSDDPLYDGQRLLQRLRIPYIYQQGYTNLRCAWVLGCPVEIRPFEDHKSHGPEDEHAGYHYQQAFAALLPGEPVPEEVGGPCCAEFAVTKSTIQRRPKSDFVRFRDWLLETELSDHVSGRIMEYSWHIIFGTDPVHCPNAPQCYCAFYGLCDLECEDEGKCGSQYTLPKYSTLPNGWPDYGWKGEWQNATAM